MKSTRSEHSRAYMREYMRIRRARLAAGMAPAVGNGVVAMIGGVKSARRGRKVAPEIIDAGGRYKAHGQRRSGGRGSRTVLVEFSDGSVRTIRDARKRARRRVVDTTAKHARNKTRSERFHLQYDPPEVFTYKKDGMEVGDGSPISLCGGVWAKDRVVVKAPESQTCKRCLASLRRREKETTTVSAAAKRFLAKRELPRVLDAIDTREVNPRGGHNRGRVRIRLIPPPKDGRAFRYVPMTTVIPNFAPAWCLSEVGARRIGLSGGSETLLPGEQDAELVTEYPYPVPPPMVEYDSHQYWRKPLSQDSARPVRYYKVESPTAKSARREEILKAARECEPVAEMFPTLGAYLDSVGIQAQRTGLTGWDSDVVIHFAERIVSKRESVFTYVAQYDTNRFTAVGTSDVALH